MGRIAVTEFITIDGVIEDPAGTEDLTRGGWSFEFNRGEEGDKFNSMPKYVVSSTLEDPEWSNSTVLKGDVVDEVTRLKQELDGDIYVHGSCQLAQTLIEHDLVDELHLMVFPLLLGTGRRLFGETSDKKPLRLVDSKTVGDGIAILTYQPTNRAG